MRNTRERTVGAALTAFGTRGFETTSLDALAAELGVRKQTILYHFPSKDALLDAVIDEAGAELIAVLEKAVSGRDTGWSRVEAVVRSVFRLAGRRPELLGLLREVSRLGPPPATRFREMLGPFIERATGLPRRRHGGRRFPPPGRPAVAAGHLLHRDRGGHRSRGTAGARRRTYGPFAGPAASRTAGLPAVGAARGSRRSLSVSDATPGVRARGQPSEGDVTLRGDVRCPRPAPTTCGPFRPFRGGGAGLDAWAWVGCNAGWLRVRSAAPDLAPGAARSPPALAPARAGASPWPASALAGVDRPARARAGRLGAGAGSATKA